MQIRLKNKKSKKVKIITLAIVIILLGGAYAAFASYQNIWPFSSTTPVNLDSPSTDEIKTGEQIKSDSVESDDEVKENPSNDVDPTATNATIMFTSTTQDSTAYRIRVLIDSVLGSGTCTLSLSKSRSATYNSTVEIQSGPSSSTCKGFDIPLTEVSAGDWTATITVTSGVTTGTATKGISIQ